MFHLVREPIDVERMRDALVRPEDGAVAVFQGVVRNHARGRRVTAIEYHAYESMALRKLVREIAIVHRLGRLEPTEASVAIVVVSAHRAAAFDSCRFAIDTLKKIVPIWKKEIYEGGEVWIEGGN
ncbi:MAG: molybdenum cofactor biosynthesis protein MoaE [Acidobacteria bacterium]|nr:MAG: molybdenum cofactor biosynthesis protein MoaE [Acidobacteriota bacterium]